MKRWLSQRRFFVVVGIPCFFVFILCLGGFRNIFILMQEGRTTATVTDVYSSGRGRSSVWYRYEVDGATFTGGGAPDHEPFTPPYAAGTTFEIRYSRVFPSFSTAQNPWTIFGQFLVGCVFLLWADFMVLRYGKKQEIKG